MRWLAAAIFSAGAAARLAAQSPEPGSPQNAANLLVVPTLDVRSPGDGTLELRATLASGWHVNSHRPSEEYLIATEARLDPADGVRFGEARYPDGKMMKFGFSEAPLSVYDGSFSITVPVTWDAARPAPALSGSIEYQACNDTKCLAPASVKFRTGSAAGASEVPAAIDPMAAVPLSAARGGGATPAAGSSRDFGDMLDRNGMFLVLLSIFVGGLALNLTPCVLP
ncbi:MAG: protein-disulfide reductase DsbD N-terminal domain-containing protein, partial [Acidobacteriota bacterium]